MLSSFGFDSKSASRSGGRTNSKHPLEASRGFSVHVFKNPTAYAAPAKHGYDQNTAPPTSWSAKPTREPVRERKISFNDSRTSNLSAFAPPFEPKQSKSRPYGIYPSALADTYIYERSVSSVSDILASPLSSSSSDSSILSESVVSLSLEVSSIRASSSTETLETTALPLSNVVDPVNVSPLQNSPPGGIYSQPQNATNMTRNMSSQPQTYPTPPTPNYRPSVESVSDDGSDTVFSEDVPMNSNRSGPYPRSAPTMEPRSFMVSSAMPPPPVRRGSDERTTFVSPTQVREQRHSPVDYRATSTSPTSPTSPYDEALLRAPPGLQGAPSLGRMTSTEPRAVYGADSLPTKRSVRWTENLICPSPLPKDQRRRGWFNRRGDQLWTNDGRYKSPDVGQEYPDDLIGYPEPHNGWMNEEGVRIDMHHRLIPKPPLRSALKRPKSSPSPENVNFINTNIV
ncbi:hypothetical protein ABKN59_003540 [Abortiporus biennis]